MPHKLNQPLTGHFDAALQLASHLHREQASKGSQIPYLAHVLGVCALVLEYGGKETQAIAALLHDAVEDCGGKPVLKQIGAQFGEEVAAIVESCTDSFEEGPKRNWRGRKEEYIRHLRECDSASLIVVAADKLHNLTAMQRDLRQLGTGLWSRFNAAPDQQRWYYGSVVEILNERLDNPIVVRLIEVFDQVCPYMIAVQV